MSAESEYQTLLYEKSDDHVATVTINRPESMNAFNRVMCDEFRNVWARIRDDDEVHAVVLRAAPGRAFCAGLDIKSEYGQPDDIWNHEDPGEALSPKWNRCWKPVVCAVHGICTAGALYFVNEADIVICSEDATFFDSHVTTGRVAVLEPIGLSRRIHLGDVLRMALLGNDERITADTALRIGIVTEVTPLEALWSRAHELAATIAEKPSVATQGTVRAVWESLDKGRQAALDQGLAYTRLANPIGEAQVSEKPKSTRPARLR
ncbi:MAG: enoyl-CoA hydratase/isomerase family protein [Deltaproteobacteria bacterium]|nr:enoyl-CoA hydratase/isomerase family protein [Deltaproteobacteria bacterium]MBW2499524.1 enoyl-CoA hydratase/isomerase family protein [Deltaproteobacteria bacterium]